ncbi:ThiF family adenylyltransferase [Lacibacter luteus]|uniref:ThiF family adenylyltransferase n=1 Tax=Lacibacter luteus TaxID=2508719 RepID=A0A4Q1CFK4_9BACT|nr:ThiF family adenylyltransferase [Lacibacter luteus]RXK58579.1 ThiF family adenylyltransferase [Lacibacter luteus]
MSDSRIVFLKSTESRVREWLLSHPDNHERGVIVLFRRISRAVEGLVGSHKFLAVDVIEMKDDWVIDSSPFHMTINMRKFPEVYFRCEQENLELGFIHNHPNGYVDFSDKDDVNEQNILRGVAGCNSLESFLVSLVLVDDRWIGRVRQGLNPTQIIPVRHITVLGKDMKVYGANSATPTPALKRQEAAFGKPFNDTLQSLRAVVVGLGGTGSPTATLLSRSGIGELVLIDADDLDGTNMNRVRGYTKDHIDRNKALSLKEFIDSLGLSVKVVAIPEYLYESTKGIDAVASADVVFGCTDDARGRDILNQAMYYYGFPYLDTGIAANIDTTETDNPYLRSYKGRVSCILPEDGACLRCQRVVTDEMIKFEEETSKRPELLELDAETLEREYYLRGGGVQAPGVGPFTSASADNMLATFMNLIKPFRKLPDDLLQDNIWIDFIHMNIHSNAPEDNVDCPFCKSKILLFKDEKKYRLDTPAYGEIKNDI